MGTGYENKIRFHAKYIHTYIHIITSVGIHTFTLYIFVRFDLVRISFRTDTYLLLSARFMPGNPKSSALSYSRWHIRIFLVGGRRQGYPEMREDSRHYKSVVFLRVVDRQTQQSSASSTAYISGTAPIYPDNWQRLSPTALITGPFVIGRSSVWSGPVRSTYIHTWVARSDAFHHTSCLHSLVFMFTSKPTPIPHWLPLWTEWWPHILGDVPRAAG